LTLDAIDTRIIMSTWDNDKTNTERNPAMTTATRTRKTTKKPARSLRLYGATSTTMAIDMTIGKEEFSYLVKKIPAAWGRGFEFKKLDNSDDVYHVNIDTTSGRHSCDCLGGLKHGHCKHQEALLALILSGKL